MALSYKAPARARIGGMGTAPVADATVVGGAKKGRTGEPMTDLQKNEGGGGQEIFFCLPPV